MAVGTILGGANTSPLVDANALDRQRAEEFFRRLAELQANYQQTFQQQGALGRSLDGTIRGTAPSVAGTQLQQGLGQTRAAISSQAAGGTGASGALNAYGAIQALGAAQAKQQQDAALLRAEEVARAQQAKAALLAAQQSATGNMAGVTAGGGVNLSGQATGAAGNIVGANEREIAARRNAVSNGLGAAGSLLSLAGGG
jgi:hypothetical protein